MKRVRALEARDEERWRKLFDGYLEFYEEIVPQAVIDATWARLLARSDNMMCLVAEDPAADLAGFANLLFHRSTWSPAWYCYLEDLFVDPAVRGGGFGKALIEATYDEADRRGATRTYWATNASNATARRLYDQLGELTPFVQYRRR